MIDKFTKFFSWLVGLPSWLRAVVLVLIAALIFCFTLTSCGQTVKVTVRDTTSGVQITTSQDKRDSSATNISINPNIQYYK